MLDATFEAGASTVALDPVNQWSVNQMIQVSGLSLAFKFSVTYSHTGLACSNLCIENSGKTYDDISIVPVPAILFRTVGTITVTFGTYSVTIPVQGATKPEDYDCSCDDLDLNEAMITKNRIAINLGSSTASYITNAEIDVITEE